MMRGAFALLRASALSLAASPAAALGNFTPPEGCTAYLTVQSKQCRVSNHYTCAADTPGDKWRADFDQQGPFFLSKIDAEAQWLESYELNPEVKQTLDPNPEDPASFTDLLGGNDSFAFGLSKSDGQRSLVTGYDRLTGESVIIDGVTLQQTEFKYTETSIGGTVLRQGRGHEYISPEWRMFFAGPGESDFGDGRWLPGDGSPMQFINPGEEGFGATEPIFDCDAVLSSYPVPERAAQ